MYNFAIILNIFWRKKEALFLSYKAFYLDGYLYAFDLFCRILKNFWIKQNKIVRIFEKMQINLNDYKNDLTCLWNIFYNFWDFEKSEFFYKNTIQNTKYDFYAYNWLSNIYFQQWKYSKAKIFAKYAIIINKKNFYSYNLLWKIFYKEWYWEKAINVFRESLKINQNNFEALKNLWIIFLKQWQPIKSQKFLKMAKNINKNDFMVNRYLSNFYAK